MASSSSSTPSSSSAAEKTNDVFVNFRGKDTRYTLVAHLEAALRRLKIRYYIDEQLDKGDEISPTLLKAIEESKVSVVVFSENYAGSKWCLEELVKIMECRRIKGQSVIPIFYHVHPSIVRYQKGKYADDFVKHEKRFNRNTEEVQRWRATLREAADLSGWDCLPNRNEFKLVEDIAMDIQQKLDSLNKDGLKRRKDDLERRILTHKQMAQKKRLNYMISGTLEDLEDLIAATKQLGDQKLEKAYGTNDQSDWEDAKTTCLRVVELKQEKYGRTCKIEDSVDHSNSWQHYLHIQKEQSKRQQGLSGI